MTRSSILVSCLVSLSACGTASTTEPTPVATRSEAPAAAPRMPGHVWVAETWVTAGASADLSRPPERLRLEIDQARFGTVAELDAPPRIALSASRPLGGASPVAEILAYATEVHAEPGEGCHLGVARTVPPLSASAPVGFDWILVSLCPVPELSNAVPDVSAHELRGEPSVGQIPGVMLALDFHRPLAEIMERGVIALDARGLDYVLLQSSPTEPGGTIAELSAGVMGTENAVAPIERFVGRTLPFEPR